MRVYLVIALIAILPFRAFALLTEIELTNITVLADRALSVPLSRLASEYSRQHGVTVTVGYAPSFEQTMAIKDGDAADLFITAHPESLTQLKQYGSFDVNSLKPLVRAKLTLVYSEPKEKLPAYETIEEWLELPAEFIAIASPAATAEGYYAQQAVDAFHHPGLPVAEIPDTETILNLQARSEATHFAILFETDALLNRPENILTHIPGGWYDTPNFISAVIPGNSMDSARKFQHFLHSEHAQREFIKYGFYPSSE